MAQNTLHYGDNLDILRRYVDKESVDLVYLAPPAFSLSRGRGAGVRGLRAQDYNVLFPERDGAQSAAQAAFYHPRYTQRAHPRLQILTVADLLEGKRVGYPVHAQTNVTFKKAPKAKEKRAKKVGLFEAAGEEE